ncbi:MAG: DUF72 domain-containing protein [Actinobacteria bacterium]|nr:MAG: DUF72 domain-containing protein [Actinomycetota bacterium]
MDAGTRWGRPWVGTAGFSYPEWAGPFYPKRLPEAEWLKYYAGRLNAVEFDVTFYRLPPAKLFANWASETPDDFRFCLKGSRYITHTSRLVDVGDQVARFFEHAAALGERLACVLWQLPPDLEADPDRLRSFLGLLGEFETALSARHVFEFRHHSWFSDPVYDILQRAGAAIALTNAPLHVLGPDMKPWRMERLPLRVPHTADFIYLRRQGWPERTTDHEEEYTSRMFADDADWVSDRLAEGKDAFVIYKKEVSSKGRETGVYGLRNAEHMLAFLMSVERRAVGGG